MSPVPSTVFNSVQQQDSENLSEAWREAESQCMQTWQWEVCKVSGADPATGLAKDPFPVSCLEKSWSLCLLYYLLDT